MDKVKLWRLRPTLSIFAGQSMEYISCYKQFLVDRKGRERGGGDSDICLSLRLIPLFSQHPLPHGELESVLGISNYFVLVKFLPC